MGLTITTVPVRATTHTLELQTTGSVCLCNRLCAFPTGRSRQNGKEWLTDIVENATHGKTAVTDTCQQCGRVCFRLGQASVSTHEPAPARGRPRRGVRYWMNSSPFSVVVLPDTGCPKTSTARAPAVALELPLVLCRLETTKRTTVEKPLTLLSQTPSGTVSYTHLTLPTKA